jgi:hypothetical protein
LVQDIVARFRVDTDSYVEKLDQAKSKNKEIAQSLLDTAGSADKAIASLQIAKGKKALGEFGLDPRQVSGVVAQIKSLAKESEAAAGSAHKLGQELREGAKEARGYDHIVDSLGGIGRGDFLGSIARFKRGLAEIKQNGDGGSIGNSLLGVGLAATALQVVGKALADVTGKAVQLKAAFEDGSKSAGDIAEELLKSVPIFGGLWATGRNIRDLLDLDGQDIERAAAAQEKLNGIRKEFLEINKQIAESQKKYNDETDRIISHTAVVELQAKGLDQSAKSKEIADKLSQDVRAATDDVTREAQAQLDAINAKLHDAPKAQDGSVGKSLSQQLADAQAAQKAGREAVAAAQADLATASDTPIIGPDDGTVGGGQAVNPKQEAAEALKKAQEDANKADERLASIASLVNPVIAEQTALLGQQTAEIRKRTAALIDAAGKDTANAFAKADPRALAALQGGKQLAVQVDAILGSTAPLQDKIKEAGDLIRSTLGDDAAKGFAGISAASLDASEAAKKFVESFKTALEGKAPITDWLNAQLGGDAVAALSPTANIVRGLLGETPRIKVEVTPEGDIKTWITKQSGEVTATVLPKGTDLRKWIEVQTGGKFPIGLDPVGTDLKTFIDGQVKDIKVSVLGDTSGLDSWIKQLAGGVPVDILPNGDAFAAWVVSQKPNIPLNAFADGKSFAAWVAAQRPNIPTDIVPQGDKFNAFIDNLSHQSLDIPIVVNGNRESIAEWLRSQVADVKVTALPDSTAYDAWVKGLRAKVDVLPNADGFYSWLETQKPNLPVSVLADGAKFAAWIKEQTPNIPTELLPKGDKLAALLAELAKPVPIKVGSNNDELLAKIKSLDGAVSLSFVPNFPNITNLISDQLRGNPVSEWLERQTEKALKGKSLSEWIRSEVELGKKNLEELKAKAVEFKKENETGAEKLAAELKTAQDLLSRGLISKDDVSRFDNDRYRDLKDQATELRNQLDKPVYSLPESKDLRTGTLFAPPTRNDDKVYNKLQDILEQLTDIYNNAQQDGITLQQLGD